MKITALALFAAALIFAGGCSADHDRDGNHARDHDATTAVKICGGCGQMKGAPACCATGAADCGGCGLNKGSPGCCKMAKGTDVTLCSHCGHVAGAKNCCAKGAQMCGCGWAKGSPACCKIPKK